MEIEVTVNSLYLISDVLLNDGEYKVNKCTFIFDEVYDSLVKKAVFTSNDGTSYLQLIENNSCEIPAEVLKKGFITIGLYAYELVDNELKKRYSPAPIAKLISKGSYIEKTKNSSAPTPSELEQLEQRINKLEEIDVGIVDYSNLKNKPKINNVELADNKTLDDLNIQIKGDYANTRVTNLEIDNLFK